MVQVAWCLGSMWLSVRLVCCLLPLMGALRTAFTPSLLKEPGAMGGSRPCLLRALVHCKLLHGHPAALHLCPLHLRPTWACRAVMISA